MVHNNTCLKALLMTTVSNMGLCFFLFLQLHVYKVVGDLSSSAQDLHQEPRTIQNQPAAGPEGLHSEVNTTDLASAQEISVFLPLHPM